MTRRSAILSQLLLAGLALFSLASVAHAVPPQLVSAVSRMTQGVSSFDIQLPLSGGTGIECRNPAAGLTIVLSFDQPVVSGDAGVTLGSATVNGFSGNTMTVQLAGITDAQTVALTVSNVANDALELGSGTVNFRTLLGDVNASGSVTGSDVNIAKAQVGATVDGSNFRSDVNFSGTITGADTNVIKSRIGRALGGGKT